MSLFLRITEFLVIRGLKISYFPCDSILLDSLGIYTWESALRNALWSAAENPVFSRMPRTLESIILGTSWWIGKHFYIPQTWTN